MVLRKVLAGVVLGMTSIVPTGGDAALSLNNCGEMRHFARTPQRVVVYGNPALENLLALDAQAQIAAVVGYSPENDPQGQAARRNIPLPVAAKNGLISAEALLMLRPDMVYSSSWYWFWSPEGASRDQMTAWGIDTWLSPAACGGQQSTPATKITFAALFREIRDLARILRRDEQAKRLLLHDQQRLETLRQRAAALPSRSLLWWYSGTNSPFIAGCCGAPDMLSQESGSRNIFAEVRALWPNVAWEEIASRDPDVLVLADLPRGGSGDSAKDKIAFLEHHPLTASMRAVKEKQYLILPGYDMDPSVRSLDALDRLITLLFQREYHD